MKAILKPIIAVLEILSGWRLFEWLWDRQLFCGGATNLGSDAGAKLIEATRDLQILDVRSRREVEGGRLPSAVSIPLADPNFGDRVTSELNPAAPTLVYCAGGFRSRKAVAVLKELGFREIFNLHRGFLAWKLGGGEVAPS